MKWSTCQFPVPFQRKGSIRARVGLGKGYIHGVKDLNSGPDADRYLLSKMWVSV